MLSIRGDMPVSTQSTLQANAHSGWGRVLGCPLPIVSCIFAAVSTHDPPCKQLFTMAGVLVAVPHVWPLLTINPHLPFCEQSLAVVETGAGVVVVMPSSFVVHHVGLFVVIGST